MIPSLLITSLEQTQSFYVTSTERMLDILKQVGKGDTEFIDSDLGFEACRKDGVKSLVTGSFYMAGETIKTDVKVLDVGTKRLLRTANAQGTGRDSIFTQVDELSRQITEGVGLQKGQIVASQKPLKDLTTSSSEAYNYYLRGVEENGKMYWENGRQFLERAVAKDPTFSSAYLQLAKAYSALGLAKAHYEAMEKAKKYAERATDKEKLYIEANYAYTIEKDREKYLRLLKQVSEKYPREKTFHFDLGSLLPAASQ